MPLGPALASSPGEAQAPLGQATRVNAALGRLALSLALLSAFDAGPTPASAWAAGGEEVGDAQGYLGLVPGEKLDWERVHQLFGPEALRQQDDEGGPELRLSWFPQGQNRKATPAEISRPQALRWGLRMKVYEGVLLGLWVRQNPAATPRWGDLVLGGPVQPFRDRERLVSEKLSWDEAPELISADGGPRLISDDLQGISGFALLRERSRVACSRAFLGFWLTRTGYADPRFSTEAYEHTLNVVGNDPLLFQAQVLRLRSLGGEEAGRAEVAFSLPPAFQFRAPFPGGGFGPASQVVVDEWVSLRAARNLKVGQMVCAEASLVSRDDQASRAYWVDHARLFSADDPASFTDLPYLPHRPRS